MEVVTASSEELFCGKGEFVSMTSQCKWQQQIFYFHKYSFASVMKSQKVFVLI